MIKILISSVGSLVGQNILDVLEMRRDNLKVIGMNTIAENHRNFRCDTVYLVPPTDETTVYANAFDKIFQIEQPDIVLAGRDIDVVFLSKYKETHPETGNRIPCGNSGIAEIMFDKYKSYQYAMEKKLPFADTFLFRNAEDTAGLQEFILKHGFPLIVKPRQGFGSLDVYFLTEQIQVDSIIESKEEVLIQEYLCPDKNFEKYLMKFKKGLPLFFHIPENNHYVSQLVISPEKRVIDIISTQHTLVSGKAESSYLYKNQEIEELVELYSKALIADGWTGSLNIQYKPDKNGKWKVFEMNPRMVGATSSRLLLGFDEMGLLINAFYPELNFPVIENTNKNGTVLKYLTDFFVDSKDVKELEEKKVWSKK